jgi:hypothetical protein
MSVQDEAGRWVRNPQCPSRRELVTLGAGAGMATLLDSPWVASATPTGEQHGWQPVNVQRFGAVGDAKTDDTAAFQRALDAAQMAGGGTVYAPSGQYLFKGTLDIPGGVTLRGSYVYVPSHPDIRDPKVLKPGDENSDHMVGTTPGLTHDAKWIRPGSDGTALLVTSGKGSEEGTPFITLHTNSSVCGLTIAYPEQITDGEPHPYPWAIRMKGANAAVFDMELLNPYQGINTAGSARHNIRNLTGQPLRRGILVDEIYDIGRIEDVHFNATWSWDSKVAEWQLAHGECFIFGRADWEFVFNTFCLGYHAGYKFIETATGECNGNFLGIAADACHRALVLEGCSRVGLLITNGEFVADMGDDPTTVLVGPENKGALRFSNSSFWGPCKQIAKIGGHGVVAFTDCTFDEWAHTNDRAAIQATSGSLLVRGCDFRQNSPHIWLGEGVERAVITANLFSGPAKIENASKNDVQIGLNVASTQR